MSDSKIEMDENVVTFAGQVLELIGDSTNICLGPVVWREDSGRKQWYFTLASGSDDFHLAQLNAGENLEECEIARRYALSVLSLTPRVIFDVDSEFEMARLCATIWLCDKTRGLLESMKN